jgi:hypothetical protein
MLVPLASISADTVTQARHEVDYGVIDDYAAAIRDGATFPPVALFRDADGTLRVGDGFHRFAAARLAGLDTIEAEVRDGTARDALRHSIEANARHGVRFSNRDKRRAVGLMLDDPEWALLSDREIARRCGVSQPFVGKLRAERGDNGYHPDPLSPEERARLAECEATIQKAIDNARAGVGAFLDAKARMTPERYRGWLAGGVGGNWADIIETFGMLLGSPEDRARVLDAFPGPAVGDLPVGRLDPALAYQSSEGRWGVFAYVSPSNHAGYWHLSVYDLDRSELGATRKPVREDALPSALHVAGFVGRDDTAWVAAPCGPVRVNPDLAEPAAV